MNKSPLGRLTPVDLRNYWVDEANDFTPWLASVEGLELLGEAVGLDLELVAKEKYVGPFRADILARALNEGEDEDHYVVIENQLERTNHDHLGKMIAYAAGLGAKTLIWVGPEFTDEHRQALDWLNENSGENLAFFGLEIQLWHIGDSPPAPQFKVVSSPNAWVKAVRSDPPRVVTETKEDQQHFWEEVIAYGQSQHSILQWRKPRPQHWYDIAVGRSGFWISLNVNQFKERARCELYMRGASGKEAFVLLEQQKPAIEAQMGQALIWDRLDNRKGSRISLEKSGVLIDHPAQREDAKAWLVQTAEKFFYAFSDRVKALELNGDEYEAEDETAIS